MRRPAPRLPRWSLDAYQRRRRATAAPAVAVDGVSPLLRRAARCSSGSTSRLAPREVVGIVGPSGCGKSTLLELIAGLQRAHRGTICGGRRSAPPSERLARCAYMPQRDLLLPWLTRDRQRRAGAENRGASARRGARAQAGAAVRALRPRRFRATRARASSPAGCASASPSCGRCSPASRCCCSTSRSPASTRSRAAEMQEWLAAALAAEPRTVRARHPRRRGGALPLRPRRRAVRRARRGSSPSCASPAPRAAPRPTTVTSPEFPPRASARCGRCEGAR